MSNARTDRFDRVGRVIGQEHGGFDAVVDGSTGTGGESHEDVREGTDDVEAGAGTRRNRTDEYYVI